MIIKLHPVHIEVLFTASSPNALYIWLELRLFTSQNPLGGKAPSCNYANERADRME